jgi:4-hydroxy-tetrahydrodipicolinate synthase
VYPASLTMFDGDGGLDEEATAAHIDRLIRDGAHGVGGTSGEFIALDDAERRRVIDVGVQAAAGRVPVIAGTGYASTRVRRRSRPSRRPGSWLAHRTTPTARSQPSRRRT